MPVSAHRLLDIRAEGGDGDPHAVLTERELQIFLLLASGKAASQVARQFKLSPITISNHAVVIRKKIGCSRSDFARVSMRFRLIPL